MSDSTCQNKGCQKDGVKEIQTDSSSGWFCEDHWMLAMMLGGQVGESE